MFEVEDFSCLGLAVTKSFTPHKNLNVKRKKKK